MARPTPSSSKANCRRGSGNANANVKKSHGRGSDDRADPRANGGAATCAWRLRAFVTVEQNGPGRSPKGTLTGVPKMLESAGWPDDAVTKRTAGTSNRRPAGQQSQSSPLAARSVTMRLT